MRVTFSALVAALMVCVQSSCGSSPTVTAQQAFDEADAGATVKAGSIVFSRIFRPVGEGASVGVGAVSAGNDGDLWIAGNFAGALPLGDTTLRGGGGFVTRLDPTGAPRWSTSLGSAWRIGLAVDAEGAAIVACPAATRHRFLSVVKLSAQGDRLWQKEPFSLVDSDYTTFDDSAADNSGGILFLGTMMGGVLRAGPSRVGGGYQVTFLVRVGGDGEAKWATRTGTATQEERFRLAVGQDGNVIVGQGSADLKSIFLANVDASGVVQWGTWLPGSNVRFSAIGLDSQGNTLLAGVGRLVVRGLGVIDEPGRAWIAKLAPTRAPLWHTLGRAEHVFADREANVLFASDDTAGKLGPSGDQLWRWSPEASGGAHIHAAAVDPDGRLIVAGSFQGRIDLGSGPVESGTGGAMFVVALAP